MTAPSLKIDFHNFGKYYLYAVKRLRACLVIQCIAAFLSYPMGVLVTNFLADYGVKWEAVQEAYYAEYPNVSMAVQAEWDALRQREDTMLMLMLVCGVIALIALVTVVGMHFITPLISYRRLYRKSCADMDYSLPVSSDGAFWGDFLAGATVTVVPHFIAAVLGLILIQPVCGVLDKLKDQSGLIVRAVVNNDVIPLLWTTFLGAIMLYALTIFIMGFCGKMFHAVAMPILVNIAVPVAHYLLFWLGMSYAAGNWSAIYMMEIRSIFVTSPLGMVLSSAMGGYDAMATSSRADSFFEPTNYYPIQQPRYLISALVVILLLIIGSWLVIRRRRAEQVGARAFAVKPAQYAIHGLTALTIAAVAAWQISRNIDDFFSYMNIGAELPHIYEIVNVYSVLLLIAIPAVYLILEVAAGERKRFGWSLARCCGTTLAAAGVTLAVMCCNGFGTFLRAPDPKNIGMVNVWLDQSYSNAYFSYDLSEPENVEMVTRLHNSIKSEYEYGNIFTMAERFKNGSLENVSRVAFEYYARDGRRKESSLEKSDETLAEILHELAVPESLVDLCVELEYRGEIVGTSVWEDDSWGVVPLSKGGLMPEMVVEAIRKDSENVTYERMFKCEPGNYAKTVYLAMNPNDLPINVVLLGDYVDGYITVYPWFENTLALLSEYGIEVDFGIPEEYKTAFLVKSMPTDDGHEGDYQCYSNLRISVPALFGLAGDESYIAYDTRYGRSDRYDAETGKRVPLTDDEIMEGIKQQNPYVQVAKIDMEQARELYPLCGGVYDVETDYGSDYYMLVMTDLTSEDLLNYDGVVRPLDYYMYVYIPAEYFDKAAEMFNAGATAS